MNDTPETDGEWNRIACYEHPQFEQGIADFARKLERERDKYYNELLTKRGLCNVQEQVIIDWKAEAEKWRAIANDNRN
jgi:hypothetical protein